MTRDEIMLMEAGRELDALVSRKVMNVKPVIVELYSEFDDTRNYVDVGDYVIYPEGVGICKRLSAYSTDIAAAWQVVEKLETQEILFQICKLGYSKNDIFWLAEFRDCSGGESSGVGNSPTAPLAICRAALLAVMKDVNDAR
jgi:hypothetical protein